MKGKKKREIKEGGEEDIDELVWKKKIEERGKSGNKAEIDSRQVGGGGVE